MDSNSSSGPPQKIETICTTRADENKTYYRPHTPPLPPPGLHNTLHLSDNLIAYLQRIRFTDGDKQQVLTFAIQNLTPARCAEYMKFAEDLIIDHSWNGILAFWNHRKHDAKTSTDNIRRKIEKLKGREYAFRKAR